MNKRITIFTPTYNRAHLLQNCYHSLLSQSSNQFRWLIIDDGSTDQTKEIVNKWINDKLIDIQYVYKENGGLHTGYNEAIKHLDTELAMCIDSDDCVAEDAIAKILNLWDISKSNDCAGLIGLDYTVDGTIIGGKLPDIKFINPIELLWQKQTGDRKYVVRSDLYKEVAPMPTFKNEKNFNPHYMILKISKKYKFLVINEPLCVVDYQVDGMSANIFKQYIDSPNSFAELRRLIMGLPRVSFIYLCKTTIHYISSSIFAKDKKFISKSPKKILTILLLPLGVALNLYIRKNCNKILKL